MAAPRIRIKLRAYDYEILDQAARDIVDHVTRTGARVVGPVPLPTERALFLACSALSLERSPLPDPQGWRAIEDRTKRLRALLKL